MPSEREVIRVGLKSDFELALDSEMAARAKALADALKEPDNVLSSLAEMLPLALFVVDRDGMIVKAEGLALESTGLSPKEAEVPVNAWGEEAVELASTILSGHALVFDTDAISFENQWRFRWLGLPDGGGGLVALAIDMSTALDAESAASSNRELLAAALEAAGGGILVQDAEGNMISHNGVIAEIFGLSDLAGPAFSETVSSLDAVHQDGRPFDPDEFPGRTALHTGHPQRNVPMGIRGAGGDRRWLSISSFPIRLDDQDAVVSSVIDITDRETSKLSLRDSEERFRLLAERAPLGIFVLDMELHFLYSNPQVEEITGRSSSEIRSLGWEALVHPDDRKVFFDHLDLAAASDPDGAPVEFRVLRPDGSIRWARSRGAVIPDRSGHPMGLVGTAADITDLRRTGALLQESEERMRAIVETAAEGIVTITEEGTIVEFNAAAERLFGYDSDEVIDRVNVFEMIAIEDRDRMLGHLRDYLAGAPPRFIGKAPAKITGLRKDGSLVPVELAITEMSTSEGKLFTGLIRDMSERKAFERELEHLATHDPLTGLPNRTMFTAQLESALARANLRETSVGVLFVDIDRVKLVTEALGHRAGDDLIVQVAARLRDTTGPIATLARFSNDQFVLFVEDLDDVGDAADAASAIIEQVNESFTVAGEEAFVDASVGIAFAPIGMGTAESLVSNAHVAMGRAKTSSITLFEVFDTDMRAWVDAQRKTEIALRHGIERDEFELHYQPLVTLDGLEVCGFEALVRWNHPHLGLLPPNEFVPIAEDSGLIVPMGEWILREAIRQSARWQTFGDGVRPLCVSINLSARQLAHPGLVSAISEAVDDVDLDPSCVAFEITETVLLEDVEAAERTLHELKELGVRLSLDDFGTGYSSLTYLCRLPIDIVKVDRSFVSQLGTGSRDSSIVEMVVSMAQTLQLDVVAEGVETEHQAQVLRQWGCRYAQGFLFSKPRPVDEVELMIEELSGKAHGGLPSDR